jgi:hypothetical protein
MTEEARKAKATKARKAKAAAATKARKAKAAAAAAKAKEAKEATKARKAKAAQHRAAYAKMLEEEACKAKGGTSTLRLRQLIHLGFEATSLCPLPDEGGGVRKQRTEEKQKMADAKEVKRRDALAKVNESRREAREELQKKDANSQLAYLLRDRAGTYGPDGDEPWAGHIDVLLLGYQRGVYYTVYRTEGSADWQELRAAIASGRAIALPAPCIRREHWLLAFKTGAEELLDGGELLWHPWAGGEPWKANHFTPLLRDFRLHTLAQEQARQQQLAGPRGHGRRVAATGMVRNGAAVVEQLSSAVVQAALAQAQAQEEEQHPLDLVMAQQLADADADAAAGSSSSSSSSSSSTTGRGGSKAITEDTEFSAHLQGSHVDKHVGWLHGVGQGMGVQAEGAKRTSGRFSRCTFSPVSKDGSCLLYAMDRLAERMAETAEVETRYAIV